MNINEKLYKIYEEKWEALQLNSKSTNATYPLLIKVSEEYENSEIKVMVVGQETDGWYGLLEENNKSITGLQESYFEYFYKSKDKNRRPFWNRKNFKYFQEKLTKEFSPKKVAFIWSNVSKIGKDGSGKPTNKIHELEKKYFNIFEEEVKILDPDIIIFTSGNRYIPIAHETIKSVNEEPVAQVQFLDFPNIFAIRTYHPNAKIKGGKKHFKKKIVEIIAEKFKR